jgi:hypothetical protein
MLQFAIGQLQRHYGEFHASATAYAVKPTCSLKAQHLMLHQKYSTYSIYRASVLMLEETGSFESLLITHKHTHDLITQNITIKLFIIVRTLNLTIIQVEIFVDSKRFKFSLSFLLQFK